MKDRILIVDFGSGYKEFLIQAVKDLGVDVRVVNNETPASEIEKYQSIKGIILSGSPSTVYLEDGKTMDKAIYDLGLPILGICYGMQLMAHQLGGKVEAMGFTEAGDIDLIIESDNPLLTKNCKVRMNHGDHITKLPSGFTNHAHTKDNQYSLITNEARKLYGTQFHPEKDESGVIKRFVRNLCGKDIEYKSKNEKEKS